MTASSARVAMARASAVERADAQATWLRGLGVVLGAVVLATTLGGHPAPGTHGRALVVSIALAVFLIAVFSLQLRPDALALILALCVAGAVLGGLTRSGSNGVAPSAAAFIAVQRRPNGLGLGLAGATVIALALLRAAVPGVGSSGTLGDALLCGLLAVVGLLLSRSRADADRVELLLAELEDARDSERRAAAAEERARIAGDLHDVLAHSLSGAAIQLEAARHIVRRDAPTAAEPVERAARLVKDGLADARDAVGALRADPPGLDDLPELLKSFPQETRLHLAPAPVGPQLGLALYRGVQEALTNAARHAPGALVDISVDGTRVTVVNGPATRTPDPSPGGGHGLDGMRERLERAGATVTAGPHEGGWRVVMQA